MHTTRNVLAGALFALLMSCGGGSGGDGTHVLKIEKWPPSGDAQTDTVGQTLPKVLRVLVTLDGNPAAGYKVHFAGDTVGTDSMVTGADGIATSSWKLTGQVGTQFVTVTLAGATGSPLFFSATGITGAPASLIAISGDGQVIGRNSFFYSPIAVRVVDQFGNGVKDQWVHWADSGLVTLGADSIRSSDPGGDVLLNVHADDVAGAVRIVGSSGTLTGSPLHFTATILDTIATVDVSALVFTPASVTIPAGSALRWIWSSGDHSIVPDSTGAFEGTATFSSPHIYGPLVFPTPGVYTYHCAVHPEMTGTITVN